MDKKNKNPNVPNLRFSSFADPFRIYTLKEVLQRISFPVTVDENKLYYQIGIRSHSKGIFYKEAEIGKQIGNKRIFWIEPNCLILNIVFAWEQAVAKTSEKEVGMVASHRFPMYKVLNNSLDYIVDFFKTEKGKQLLQMASPGGAGRNKTLNQDFFLNSKIYLPSLNEQLKTSNLIKLIEDRIEIQIKIIADCLSYRNAIVDYFFESLSSNWRKVKLSNILKEYSELHVKDNSIIHATLSKEGVYPKTDRYDRDFLVKDEEKKYKVSHLNDICYNPANLKFGVITRNTFGDCIISPIYITFTINNNYLPKFVELLVTRKQFITQARKYEQGTVYERMAVNSSDLLSMNVFIPSLSIQQKIVDIVDIIDNKITNEKELLNLYKMQKDYLLKNMFI